MTIMYCIVFVLFVLFVLTHSLFSSRSMQLSLDGNLARSAHHTPAMLLILDGNSARGAHHTPAWVLILDGNSARGGHVRSDVCYLICLRHLFRLGTHTNMIFFQKNSVFLYMCATRSELPSNISTMSRIGPMKETKKGNIIYEHLAMT